jgi:hypothetical protein
MDIAQFDKATLQEIVDKLSLMVLHLHEEALQLRHENAKMNSTLTELNDKLDKLSHGPCSTSSAAISTVDSVKQVTPISAVGEFYNYRLRTICSCCTTLCRL